ncbi:MAG: ACT domain-containing protein [Actinomycetes bacterium]
MDVPSGFYWQIAREPGPEGSSHQQQFGRAWLAVARRWSDQSSRTTEPGNADEIAPRVVTDVVAHTVESGGVPIHENRGVSAEGSLELLLAAMSPQRRPGAYVFVVVDDLRSVPDAELLASVVEAEGVTLVLARQDADRAGLAYDFIAGWITLQVHSALDAVGLTAAVSTALTDAGISCNVIAGYHHDHLLVPFERLDDAFDVLHGLSASHRSKQPTVTVRPAGADDRRLRHHRDRGGGLGRRGG